MRRLKRFFLTGIIVTLPAAATIYLLWLTFNFLDRLAGNAINTLLGRQIPGLGLAVMLVIVLAAGALTTNIVGRYFLNLWDNLMYRIPLVNSVYRTLKQMVEAFWRDDKKAFQQVVMIEYPRRGIYSLGFLVGPASAEINMRAARDMVAVFVPTTPNPTSGFLLMLPLEDITPLDMPVEDGIKYIVSAGVVAPDIEPLASANTGWKHFFKGLDPGTRFKSLHQRGRSTGQ